MGKNDIYVVAGLFGLGALGLWLWKREVGQTFSGVGTGVQGLGSGVATAATGVGSGVGAIGSAVGSVATETAESYKSIQDQFQAGVSAAGDLVSNIVDKVKNVASGSGGSSRSSKSSKSSTLTPQSVKSVLPVQTAVSQTVIKLTSPKAAAAEVAREKEIKQASSIGAQSIVYKGPTVSSIAAKDKATSEAAARKAAVAKLVTSVTTKTKVRK